MKRILCVEPDLGKGRTRSDPDYAGNSGGGYERWDFVESPLCGTKLPDATAAKGFALAEGPVLKVAQALRQCSVISQKRPFTASRLAKILTGRSLRPHPMSHMRTIRAFTQINQADVFGPQPTFSRIRTCRTAA